MRLSALATAVIYLPYYFLAIRALLSGAGLGLPDSLTRRYAKMYAIGMFANMSVVMWLEIAEFIKGSNLAPSSACTGYRSSRTGWSRC